MALSGKTIIVTGAGQGIGRGLCFALAEIGASVVAVSRTKENLEFLTKQCPLIKTVCVDLADWKETKEALENVEVAHGLVNNAGVGVLESFLDITEESFDKTIAVNLKAVINVSQIVAKKMISSKIKGSIVNISSQASLRGLNGHGVYCASKAGLDGLTRVMALELGPHQIRVNCVNPTVVMTAMGRSAWSDPDKAETILSRIPLGKFAEVKDVVQAVIFLLGDDSSMVNGTVLPIDGGFLAA